MNRCDNAPREMVFRVTTTGGSATRLKTLHRVNERDGKRNRAYGRYGKDDHGNYRHLLYSWLDACYALAKTDLTGRA